MILILVVYSKNSGTLESRMHIACYVAALLDNVFGGARSVAIVHVRMQSPVSYKLTFYVSS